MNSMEKYEDQVLGRDIVNIDVPNEFEDDSPNLMASILRRWHIVLLIVFLICLVSLPAIWLLKKPSYVVTGAIRVAPILSDILTSERDRGDISDYHSFMNTQVELITSSQIVERVADDLKDRNLAFFQNRNNDIISKIKREIKDVKINPDPARVLKNALISGEIVVTAPRDTELIEIKMVRQESEEAKIIVNAFLNAYMNVGVAKETSQEDLNLGLLEEQRNVKDKEIEDLRQGIYMLAKEYGTDKLESRQDLMMRRLASLSDELTMIEKSKHNIEAQIMLLERNNDESVPPDQLLQMRQNHINNDVYVATLAKDIAKMEQTLLVSRETLTPAHPEYKLQEDLLEIMKETLEENKEKAGDEFDALLTEELEKSRDTKLMSARESMEHIESYEKLLKQWIEQEDQKAIEVGRLGLNIQNLQDDLTMKKERLDLILERIQDLELHRKRPTRISLWRTADVASVIDKRMKLTFGLVFGALALGVWAAYLRDKADKRLRSPEDAAKRIGIRIIGTTTSMYAVKASLLPEQIIDDYQTIRANLELINGHGIPKILVVTSPSMREGKTTFSVNLATSLAEAGKKVLLVDGDLRKPDVARLLNIPRGTKGLQEVLSGVQFEQAVYSLPTSGLDILSSDFYDNADNYELLALSSTSDNIKKISEKYDHVIIDTPPVLSFPDALLWAKIGDAVVLTSFSGQTTLPELKEAKERLLRANARVLGTVVSSVEAEHSYYHHSAAYYAQSARARKARKKALLSFGKQKS